MADKATVTELKPAATLEFNREETALLWELVNTSGVKASGARTLANIMDKIEAAARVHKLIE